MIIAHITDTHVALDGRAARDLSETLARINALQPRPDCIIHSGDAADNGRPDQYARLRDILAESGIDVFLVPGNHDRRPALRAVLPDRHYPDAIAGERINYALDRGRVQLIGLDTSVPGRPGGSLGGETLTWLDDRLAATTGRPTLVFMHHPPFRTGVNLADMFGFHGLRRFKAIVARHPHLRRIVAGHVHSVRHGTIGQATVSTTLSTTPQMVPELFERRIAGFRPEPAGFALHAWHDGDFATTTFVRSADGSFSDRAMAGAPNCA